MDCLDDITYALNRMCEDQDQTMMELDFDKLSIKKKRKVFHVVIHGAGESTRFLRTFPTKVAASKYIYKSAKFCEDIDGNVINPHNYHLYDCECSFSLDCGKNKATVLRCILRNDGWQDYDIITKYVEY